jgi:starch synthase
MIAQRYGTLPIVRYTGGLRDTVDGYDGKKSRTPMALVSTTTTRPVSIMVSPSRKKLSANRSDYYRRENAMALDRSWKKSANAYEKLYNALVKKA